MNEIAPPPAISLPKDSKTPKSYIQMVVYNQELRKLITKYRTKGELFKHSDGIMYTSASKKKVVQALIELDKEAFSIFEPTLDRSWSKVFGQYLVDDAVTASPYAYVGFPGFARKIETLAGKISYQYISSNNKRSLQLTIRNQLKPSDLESLKHLLLDLTSPLEKLDWPDSTKLRQASLVMDLKRKYPKLTQEELAGKFSSEYPNEKPVITSSNEIKDRLKEGRKFNF